MKTRNFLNGLYAEFFTLGTGTGEITEVSFIVGFSPLELSTLHCFDRLLLVWLIAVGDEVVVVGKMGVGDVDTAYKYASIWAYCMVSYELKEYPAGAIFSRGQNSYSCTYAARAKPLRGKLEGPRTNPPSPLPPSPSTGVGQDLTRSGSMDRTTEQGSCYVSIQSETQSTTPQTSLHFFSSTF